MQVFMSSLSKTLDDAPEPARRRFWCDAGLLNQVGIPVIVCGPKGEGFRAKEESVGALSIGEVTSVLEII